MAALVVLVVVLAIFRGSDAAWCVCNPNQSSGALQKTLDYACGAGADCSPIIQNGACYNPNTVAAHCSYAANSYYQRKQQVQTACDFAGTAMVTSSDPSPGGGCTFPATPSAAGTGGSTTNTTPSGSSTSPGSTFNPPNSGIGGLGPTGSNSFDGSDGGFLPQPKMGSLLLTILLKALVFLRI